MLWGLSPRANAYPLPEEMLAHGCMAAVGYMHAMIEPCWKAYWFVQRYEQLWDPARTPEGLTVAESKPLPSTMASFLSGSSLASSGLSRGGGEQVLERLTAAKNSCFDLHFNCLSFQNCEVTAEVFYHYSLHTSPYQCHVRHGLPGYRKYF